MAGKGKQRRAIGIIRVSEVKGRDRKGDKDGNERDAFVSPDVQRERIRAACEREGLRLVTRFGDGGMIEELDVSGGTPLAQRRALAAVEAVEDGEADVIVGAYFDRLFRSLRVQDEFVSRVEDAGGQVLAVDVGQVTNGSAGKWLSGTMLGAVSEYQRRAAAERSRDAQASAVARGVLPWPNIPAGYVRGPEGSLVPDPDKARAVAEAVKLRANRATIAEVREHLKRNGIVLSYHGTTHLLKSRVLLGEIHFGDLVNLKAHEPVVDRELWKQAQRVTVSRGRRAESERLLARLGVLRCASCDGRMVVGTQTQNGRCYPFYRCGHVREDCAKRVTISAETIETLVVEAVRSALADVEGRASAETKVREAEQALGNAQANLDAAIRTLAGFEDEASTRDRLVQLREARDNARDHLEHLGGPRAVVTINAATDWDRLSLDARRDLIRATVERVAVAPGRGAGRVSVEFFA